ncbi:hypothetical protein GI374_16260 [Paracoccus sp. S-4012]|nr:hypothetical protein [Paracoccus sp. S-4012]
MSGDPGRTPNRQDQ